jgi:hypothetical protein
MSDRISCKAHILNNVSCTSGGPGAPAKAYIQQNGFAIQRARSEHYDLVGFDPRGVGESE